MIPYVRLEGGKTSAVMHGISEIKYDINASSIGPSQMLAFRLCAMNFDQDGSIWKYLS